MQNVIVIFGPTASGKSSVAIELAKYLDGEIVSSDSMQIYKGMDIGTAKITSEEMQGIPHHLIDFIDYQQDFSVADYKKLATEMITDILSRGKTPIICGGTGLYIDALVKNITFNEENNDDDNDIKNKLIEERKIKGNEWLHNFLNQLDPISAGQIHQNNVKRVIRALEVTIRTGIPFSKHKKLAIENSSVFNFKLFSLEHTREILYKRINERVDIMFDNGLLEEAKKLYEENLFDSKTAAQAIGYKELNSYFLGNNTIEEVKDKIKMETRRYAKRQITWFKRYNDAKIIACQDKSPKEIANKISHFLSCDEK